MTEFVPRVQSDITDALLAYRTSDPDVSAELLPTDLSVGSLERAHVESLAMLIEESDQRMALGAEDAISNACYHAFGFDLQSAQSALGSVIFSCLVATVDAITIPIGTQVIASSGAKFLTTAVGTIASGATSSESVPVKASVAGVDGNVAANSINQMVTVITGIDSVINAYATAGGSDIESDDSRAVRFASYIATIVRGTKEALEFAALSATNAIIDARAIEPFLLDPIPTGVPDAGLVWLFVDNGSDAALDAGVKAAISNWVEGFVDGTGRVVSGYKAAGTVVKIIKCPRVNVCVRATISILPDGVARWTDIQDNLTAAAENYFSNLRIAETASYGNLLTALTDCDTDISEVVMAFWVEGDTVPDITASVSADDLVVVSSTDANSNGSRCCLFEGTSSSVTYPEWILG
jgi:hypothetical protein